MLHCVQIHIVHTLTGYSLHGDGVARGTCVLCLSTVPRGGAACNCKYPEPEYESGVTFVLKVNQCCAG